DLDAIVNESPGVRHLGIGGEIAGGDPERVGEAVHAVVSRCSASGGEKALRVEKPQRLKLVGGGRFGDGDAIVKIEREAGIVLNLLATDARVEGEDGHSARLAVEAEHRELGDDAEHSSGNEAAFGAGSASAQEAWAGDEIDLLDEA